MGVGRDRELSSVDDVDVHVGGRLRSRRMELGLSQTALGRRLGVTFSQIQKYEKGVNRIGAGRLFHVAAHLRVPVQYFFAGLDAPRPPAERISHVGPEAVRLQAAFAGISDANARQALLSLALSMVEDR